MSESYYDLDGITIYHGDNADVEWPEPAEVGLLLTDPPYGIGLDTNYHGGNLHDTGYLYEEVANDGVPFNPESLLAYPRCVIWGANNFAPLLPVGGAWIAWDKVTRDGVSTRGSDAELAWCRGVSADGMTFMFRHMWKGAFRDSERSQRLHPTQKPAALMRWILDKWTAPDDLVFDPYMGSGPVAQACADLGRRYIGIEIVEEYCEAAVDRLGQLTLGLEA